jgi:hypothetical protein
METSSDHHKYVNKQMLIDAIRLQFISVCDKYPSKIDEISKEFRYNFGNLALSTHSIDDAVKHTIKQYRLDYKPENCVHFMDWHRGCSITVVDAISKMQADKKNKLLPGKREIQRVNAEMQYIFFQKVGFSDFDPNGWNMNIPEVLGMIIEGRLRKDTTELTLTIAMDGWSVGVGRDGAITWGIKIDNTNCLVPTDERDTELVRSNHSLNNVQIIGFATVKDTAENARKSFATPIKNIIS